MLRRIFDKKHALYFAERKRRKIFSNILIYQYQPVRRRITRALCLESPKTEVSWQMKRLRVSLRVQYVYATRDTRMRHVDQFL